MNSRNWTKNVNGEDVAMSEEEINEKLAEEAAYEATLPIVLVRQKLAELDTKLPRYAEPGVTEESDAFLFAIKQQKITLRQQLAELQA